MKAQHGGQHGHTLRSHSSNQKSVICKLRSLDTTDSLIAARDPVEDVYGPRHPYTKAWNVRVDEQTVDQPDKWVQSSCVMCSIGCGLDVSRQIYSLAHLADWKPQKIAVKDGKMVGVRGRESDRVNLGRLGPKGLNSWRLNAHPDRLTYPQIRKNGKMERVSWDEAMELIVRKSKHVLDTLGRHGIGFVSSLSS